MEKSALVWSCLFVKLSLLAINSARAEFFTDLTYLSLCLMQQEEFNNHLLNQNHSEKESICMHLPTEGPDKPP